jgi:hypothetical protein
LSHAFGVLVRELLESGLHVRFRAAGRSMAPAVSDGDVVTIAPVDPAEVAIGDVILCETWRGPLAHRVATVRVRNAARRFVLRGDRSLEDDAPIDGLQVRGRLIAVEHEGRIDHTAFARGAWARRVNRLRARCGQAIQEAARSARQALAALRSA